MTEPKLAADKKEGKLSKGAKTHCIDIFASWFYKRREEIYSKYMEKGTAVEEQAITLLSLITRNVYFKNEENITNEYISGTPDLFLKENGVIIEIGAGVGLPSIVAGLLGFKKVPHHEKVELTIM